MDDWQVSFGGYTWTEVISLDGIDSLPSVRSGNVQRPFAGGRIAGPQVVDERIITMVAEVCGDVRAEVDAMSAATVPTFQPAPLRFRVGHGGDRQVYAQVRNRSIPNDVAFYLGTARVVLQFACPDPRIYAAPGSGGTHSGSTGPGSRTGGLGFPTGFPLGFGTVANNSLPTTNNGNTPAPWTAVLNGPLTSPTIELVSSGDRLSWDGLAIASGQQLVISSRSRTALLGGTSPRYPGPRRDWFEIPVGADDVRLTAESGDGTLVMQWADTWL